MTDTQNGIIMDLFKPQHLRERQCIAHTMKKEQCNADMPKQNLRLASMSIVHDPGKFRRHSEDAEKFIRLLICNNHNDSHVRSQLEQLVDKYHSELEEYARTHGPPIQIQPCRSSRNARTTMRQKLHSRIKDDQFACGSLYIFTWSLLEGYVKIGCTKGDVAKRIKEWSECYPGAVQVYSVQLSFPQRMEELIHLQMADRRYNIPCYMASCKQGYHDEWFKCSVEEMVSVADEWTMLATEPELYRMDTRGLTCYWTDVLAQFFTDPEATIKPRDLLQTAKTLKVSSHLERVHIEDG